MAAGTVAWRLSLQVGGWGGNGCLAPSPPHPLALPSSLAGTSTSKTRVQKALSTRAFQVAPGQARAIPWGGVAGFPSLSPSPCRLAWSCLAAISPRGLCLHVQAPLSQMGMWSCGPNHCLAHGMFDHVVLGAWALEGLEKSGGCWPGPCP